MIFLTHIINFRCHFSVDLEVPAVPNTEMSAFHEYFYHWVWVVSWIFGHFESIWKMAVAVDHPVAACNNGWYKIWKHSKCSSWVLLMTDIKPLVQKLAFLAIFIKNVAMSKLGPADSVEKKGRDQTVCSEINIFSQFHHTVPCQTVSNQSQCLS